MLNCPSFLLFVQPLSPLGVTVDRVLLQELLLILETVVVEIVTALGYSPLVSMNTIYHCPWVRPKMRIAMKVNI